MRTCEDCTGSGVVFRRRADGIRGKLIDCPRCDGVGKRHECDPRLRCRVNYPHVVRPR